MIFRDRDHSEGWGVGVNVRMATGVFFKVCLFLFFSVQLLEKHTLNPEITLLYQFHAQKALLEVPKICNINFWIENDTTLPPLGTSPKIHPIW